MSEPLRAVVVGTGFGCLVHVRALRQAGFDVMALVGRDPQRTAARAARWHVPQAFTALGAALALPGVRVVTVATPPHTHAALVEEAVRAGTHVLCEKPMAADAAEARRMLAAAEAAGVVHCVGNEFRFSAAQALAARAVRDGVIGAPCLATFVFAFPWLTDPAGAFPDWWLDAGQGGGWLGAFGSHVVDQVRTTVGEITGLSARLQTLSARPRMTADDTYTIHARTENGAVVVLQSSAAAWGPTTITRVVGTHGTLAVELEEVRVSDARGDRVLPVPDDLAIGPPEPPPVELSTAYEQGHGTGLEFGPYVRLYERFRDRILGRTVPTDPAFPTFADGAATMAVLDAARRSSDEGGAWTAVSG